MISSIFYFFFKKLPGTPASESSYEEVESRPDLLFILGRERFCWRVAASTATLKSQFVSKKNFVVEKIVSVFSGNFLTFEAFPSVAVGLRVLLIVLL